jgi:MinD superfamily P-loop ATPase
MISVCWAAKGGSGTTVVTATMAIAATAPTLLIDLAGDVPAVLGIPEPDGPGVFDWLASDAPLSRIGALELRIDAHTALLPRGEVTSIAPERWALLATWLRGERRTVVVDAGSNGRPPMAVVGAADHALLVTRPCYLALRAAVRTQARRTGIVLIDEPGRALRAGDIEASLGVPVVATVLLDPAIARAVDAGLLLARVPSAFRHAVRLAA